jgi:hypothetical protein
MHDQVSNVSTTTCEDTQTLLPSCGIVLEHEITVKHSGGRYVESKGEVVGCVLEGRDMANCRLLPSVASWIKGIESL